MKETLLGKSDGGNLLVYLTSGTISKIVFWDNYFFATFALLNGEDTETEVTSAGANCAFM